MNHNQLIIAIGIIFISLFGAADFASAGWSVGKFGSAIDFNGTSTYVSAGNVSSGIQIVSFWLKPDNLTNYVIDLNGTQTITLASAAISANNFTSPTIY
ncbi:hypothetical protein KJ636_01340, partial [Patescibacteria group bacterium]|nr:hypothetical protein [Patescibacteria group bacterium]